MLTTPTTIDLERQMLGEVEMARCLTRNVTHLLRKIVPRFQRIAVSDCGTRRVPVGAVGHPSADGPSSGGRVCASTAAAASTGPCRARPCSDP